MKKILFTSFILVITLGVTKALTISTSVTWSSNQFYNEDIIIEPGGILTINNNAVITMGGFRGIYVLDGGKLIGNTGTITKPSSQTVPWRGILVNGTNQILGTAGQNAVSLTDFTVDWAEFGLWITDWYHLYGPSPIIDMFQQVYCNNVTFSNNGTHVFAEDYNLPYVSTNSRFENCSFLNSPWYNYPMYLEGISGWKFINNEFDYNSSASLSGLHCSHAENVQIIGNTFRDVGMNAIHLSHKMHDIEVHQNQIIASRHYNASGYSSVIDHNYAGIDIGSEGTINDLMYNIDITENSFYPDYTNASLVNLTTYVGVVMRKSRGAFINIADNEFSDYGCGVDVANMSGELSQIRRNEFNHIGTGVISDENNPQLYITCNNFNHGINGIRINQMPLMSHMQTGPHNTFNTLDALHIWNLDNTATFEYGIDLFNPNTIPSNNIGLMFFTIQNTSVNCTLDGRLKPKDNENTADGNEADGMEIYPNPAKGQVNLTLNASYTSIEIYNVLGKRMFFEANTGISQHTIDLSSFDAGVYLVNATYADKVVTQRMVVK